MDWLREDILAIDGFAGIRERRLIMDDRLFHRNTANDAWNGLGQLVYFANAWFLPQGRTGLHNHRNIDILSIVTHGEILHKGTLQDNGRVRSGQVQLQRTGSQGFDHDEQNPSDQYPAMLQLWMLPEGEQGDAQFTLFDTDEGVTCVYGGEVCEASTRVDIVRLKALQSYRVADESLAYVFAGNARVEEDQTVLELRRGDMVRGHDLSWLAHDDMAMVVIRKAS